MISRIQNECRLKDCIRYEIEEIQPDDGHKINVEVDKNLLIEIMLELKSMITIMVCTLVKHLNQLILWLLSKIPVLRLRCILLSLRMLVVKKDLR